ncbi:MAG: alkaline phosphatase PhoX [Methylococcaceae bacterium]
MKFHLNYVCLVLAALSSSANALTLTDVSVANPKVAGFTAPNILSPELDLRLHATGSMKLDGATANTQYYGYINNSAGTSAMVPVLGSAASPSSPASEASKTEPDKNTYLVLEGQKGADANYNYGSHFLFQGHESGAHGYITRINLDADGAHRVTLMTDTLADGSLVPVLDGSTWYPFSGHLLFAGEGSAASGIDEGVVLQATTDYPSTVTKLDGVIGHAGWEGIQADSLGNLWLIADQGGSIGTVNNKARQANSFVYRFVPKNVNNLSEGGRLQALQVWNNKAPIVFHAGQADADILSQDAKDLHTYKKSFKTAWVTIHDTDIDGFVAFDATAAAKTANATPFKRPENGVFRPSAANPFTQFFFTETGDTNKDSQAGSAYGGYGAVFSLTQVNPAADTGTLRLFYLGDLEHSGFDNIAFLSTNQLLVVEDASDTVHAQRNGLDSGYAFNLAVDYSTGTKPVRFLAEGRDASATLDSATAGLNANGDNEITGIHVSNGDASVAGLLGSQNPTPFKKGWRVFWTQQHGDNNTFEIVPNK